MRRIECECGALFGIEQADGSLQIKYRDLTRTISGGSVGGPCRKCGQPVTWSQPVAPYIWPPITPTGQFCNCACSTCMSGSCCQYTGGTYVRWHITNTTNGQP